MPDLARSAPHLPVVSRDLRRSFLETERSPAEWRLAAFAGRFCEVSGTEAGASLTMVFRLVLEAQRQGEPVAWIAQRDTVFFPPDVAEVGVDLAALPVVRVPTAMAAARVADYLLRSGGFGLVVFDMGTRDRLPLHAQTRLTGLAKQHGAALLCITEKGCDRPSVGSLVSLRAHVARSRDERGERDGTEAHDDREAFAARRRFRCEVHVLKDKRRGPGWRHVEVCHGPDGLC